MSDFSEKVTCKQTNVATNDKQLLVFTRYHLTAFNYHLTAYTALQKEAKEGQGETVMDSNCYFGAAIWLLVYDVIVFGCKMLLGLHTKYIQLDSIKTSGKKSLPPNFILRLMPF